LHSHSFVSKPGDTDGQTGGREKSGWNTIAWILGALLAYPLSVGPANSLAKYRHKLVLCHLRAFDWAGEMGSVAAILEWYISLWVHP
jgi:hypothetical protein